MAKDIIDSHSSQINNKRLQMLFFNIDQSAPLANNTLHFSMINSYFNNVKQLYMNVKSILSKEEYEKCDEKMDEYYALVNLIETQPVKRTKSNLRKLIRITEEFNFNIMNNLHQFDYFFRMGNRQPKGLTKMEFNTENVFSGSKGGLEDGEEEEF